MSVSARPTIESVTERPPVAGGGPGGRPERDDAGAHAKRWYILAILSAVAFMAQLDMFVVNIAIPQIGRSFGSRGLDGLSWVLNAYSIVFAALLVPSGRLADHYGRRRFLLAGVVVFTAASVVCALAPGLGVLVAGRIVQAVGAALIVPTSLGLLLPAFTRAQHTLVVGVWAGVASIAASSGPPVGGLLVGLNWRWIFVINVPIGIVTLIAGARILPEVRGASDARLPDVGSVLAVLVAITALVLGTVEAPYWGWGAPGTIALFVVAAGGLAGTVHRTRTAASPLIEPTLFRSVEFTTAAIALFLFFITVATWLLVTVLFLQNVWGYSAVRAGLAMMPGPLVSAAFAVNGGRIGARWGRTAPAVAGMASAVAAPLVWILTTPAHPAWLTDFLPGLVLAGAGVGLVQAPLFAAASTLATDRTTTGSAVLNMARQVGTAVGVAVLVTLMAAPHPDTLPVIHRGWWLELTSAAAAGVVLLFRRPRRSAQTARRGGASRR